MRLPLLLETALRRGLGINQLTNPDFSVDLTGWVATGTPTTLEFSAGRAHIVGDSANDGIAQTITLTLNAVYRLQFDYEILSGTVNVLKTGMTSISGLSGTGTSVTTFTETDGTARSFRFVTAAAGEFFVDNVRMQRVQ